MNIPPPNDQDHSTREAEITARYQARLRLEGAAADLLAALEGIVNFLNHNPHQEPWKMNPHLLRADAAIRKAKA